MRRFFFAASLAGLTLGVVACTSNSGDTSPTGPSDSSAPPAGAITINVVGINGAQSFSPNPATVPPGQTVVWHNVDTTVHRVVLNDGKLDTGNISPGRFSSPMTLVAPGPYHCTIHPEMVGTISEPSPLNLTGTWSGMLGQSVSGSALRVTWVATQTGATVSGPATMVKPSLNVPATGMMTGTLSGNQLTLNYSVPEGAVPVYQSCMVAGSGSAMATSQTISGTLETTFTDCLGSGLESPESAQLRLTKQ